MSDPSDAREPERASSVLASLEAGDGASEKLGPPTDFLTGPPPVDATLDDYETSRVDGSRSAIPIQSSEPGDSVTGVHRQLPEVEIDETVRFPLAAAIAVVVIVVAVAVAMLAMF